MIMSFMSVHVWENWLADSIYSETCIRRNLNKAEICSVWTNSMVPARSIGITVLFILYNAESAHRENGKQYLKNV
jgi:hypothetical protein